MYRNLVLLAAFTLLLHLPFLGRAIHNDEVQYLDTAANVFDHPLTPTNFTFVFMGLRPDMAGHPHPPLNAYMLAALWSARGHIAPRFFHAAYLIFPLAIAVAAYFIAARYTSRPLWVALIITASPVVMVHANSLDSDTPALAFLLMGAAFFLARRFVPAAILLTLAGLTALQSFAVIAILLLDYPLRKEKLPRAAWVAVIAPFAALGIWQAAQALMIGRMPAEKLWEYLHFPAFSTLRGKLNSALVLVEHLGALVVFAPMCTKLRQWIPAALLAIPTYWLARDYPAWERVLLFAFVMLGVETVIWLANRIVDRPLLALWCLGYLLFAMIVFFAGAARYLMPLAVPLAILFVAQNEQRNWRLIASFAVGLFLSFNLSVADYELARIYATVAPPPGHDFLVNGEWGFRYYLTRAGGQMIEPSSIARPGRWIVTSDLAVGGQYGSPAESLAIPIESHDLKIRTPFRIIDRYAHSGFETSGAGLLPFSFSQRPIDRVTYALDSPFLNVPEWTPTRVGDELVFLAPPNVEVRVDADPSWQVCEMRLFARGEGSAAYVVPPFFARNVVVHATLDEPMHFNPSGVKQLIFRADASSGVRVGWAGLVCY